MTLPNVTLFPQSLLPLYIFEPRYRRMLDDALDGNRMFVVALQKPGRTRETPYKVAGLGIIRVGVDNEDETSHVILQGITRVELLKTTRYKPYRMATIRPLQVPHTDNVAIDALIAKVRDLVNERVQLGLHWKKSSHQGQRQPSILTIKDVIGYLKDLDDADQVADLVSCTLIPGAAERQTILETVEVVPRLKRLIHFLLAEIKAQRKSEAS